MAEKLSWHAGVKAGCYEKDCHALSKWFFSGALYCDLHLPKKESKAITSVLEEATNAVHGARNKDYADPLTNHSRTANRWTSYLRDKYGVEITVSPEDVCFMNIDQKIARSMNSITRDTLVDIAGYAYNVQIVQMLREDPDSWKARPEENEGLGGCD